MVARGPMRQHAEARVDYQVVLADCAESRQRTLTRIRTKKPAGWRKGRVHQRANLRTAVEGDERLAQ